MQGEPLVFISYCRSDGSTFATQLRDRLIKEHPEITLWQDVISERGGRDWWLQITEALDQVEYMILGLTPNAMTSATVRNEWRYARQKGVCILPVLGSSDLDFSILPRWIRDQHIEDIGYDAQQESFNCTDAWQKFIDQLKTPCKTQHVPFMVDDLPQNFVERPREFDQLVALLRDEKREEPVAITAALQGAGGFGKTTLAKALCHDERIQEVFDDGVLWVTLGETPGEPTSKIIDLIEVLSGERPGFTQVEGACTRLAELLADRDILMVIDDVWNAMHLRPFLNGGKRCARLITTRNMETLPAKTLAVNVDAMQPSEAIKLLADGLSPTTKEMEHIRLLSAKLGEWPLLLRLVNSVLRERVQKQNQPLDDALNYTDKALAKRGLTAFDTRDALAREQAVVKTIGVSLELLNNHERDRFTELAIFPEDTDVPISTVARTWEATGGLDELDTEELCAHFHRLSLLLTFDLTIRQIRLHDVMRKFLVNQLPFAAVVHQKLVKAWGDPHHLPDDYAWRFLTYHLAGGQRVEQLRELLLDFAWMQSKLNATDIAALVADYDFLADQASESKIVQKALQLSAHVLSSNNGKTQLAAQLLGRLLAHISPSIQALLHQASQSKEASWLCPLKSSLIPPGGPLLRTLVGHTESVNVVAISENGEQAISASDDHTVKVWELKTGKLIYSLENQGGSIIAVAISADCEKAVMASRKTVRVLELKTGKLIYSFENQSGLIIVVAISTDAAQAISASNEGSVRVWDLRLGKLAYSLEGQSGSIEAVAISAKGKYGIAASEGEILQVWEMETGKPVRSLKKHGGRYVYSIAITADGAYTVLALLVNYLRVWKVATGELLHSLDSHTSPVRAVVISADGEQIISASDDNTLKVWALKTGTCLYSLEGHTGPVRSVAISIDGGQAVSASSDKTLKVWDLKMGRDLNLLDDHSSWVNAVAISADGEQAVSASADHTLKIWELTTGKALHSLKGHNGQVQAVAISEVYGQVVSASADKTLKTWDFKTGKLLYSFEGHDGWINTVAINEVHGQVVSGSADKTLRVWDLKTGKLQYSLFGHNASVYAAAIAVDSAQVVSASADKTVKVWDLKTGKFQYSLEGHDNVVFAVAITADNTLVVSASADKTVKVWDLQTGKLLHSLEGHSSYVNAVAITADSKLVVSGSFDKTLMIWELKTGKHLHSLVGHGGSISALAITAEGAQIVSASSDKTLKAWDLQMGEPLATFNAEAPIRACTLAPGGKTVVAGDTFGRMHFLRFRRT